MSKRIINSLFLLGIFASNVNGQGLAGLSIEGHAGYNLVNNVNHCPPGWGESLHFNPQFGGQLEYDLNEYVGFGLDYTYAKNDQWNYKNTVQSGAAFISTNIANIFSPGRDGFLSGMAAYLNVGGGVSNAKWSDVTYPTYPALIPDGSTMTKPFFLLGVNIEYNVTDFMAVGLHGQMRNYFCKANNDLEPKNFHPTTEGGNNMFTVGLGLRYKFLDQENMRSKKPSARDYSTFNKFSIEAHGGANLLMGDKKESTGDINPQIGLQLEYDFSPVWGLGIDYTWAKNDQWNYDNTVNNFAIYNSVNLLNAFMSNRGKESEAFNLYFVSGIGEDFAQWSNVIDPETEDPQPDGDNFSYPHVLTGIQFEYCIDKFLSIGLNGQYRYYTGGPVEHGAGNCFHPTTEGDQSTLSFGLGVRYKFGGDRNVRNVTRF